MSYELISKPPWNIGAYVESPENDIREKYVECLSLLLRQSVFHVKTTVVPIGWVEEAIKRAEPKQYRIMMQRAEVNFGEVGTAHGIFYFEWQKSN